MSVLIICRVDQVSAAPKWLRELPPEISVIYSTYGNADTRGTHHYVGGKWSGIFDLFAQQPTLAESFDTFWFPDDDIQSTVATVVGFLRLFEEEKFELAQPALTPDSYFAYRETVLSPRFRFRRTNFVELMMPCMDKRLLKSALPLFKKRHAALGLDWMWQNLAREPLQNVAIIDAFPMRHSRARNNHLAGKMSAQAISLVDERRETFEALSIKPLSPIVYSGTLSTGVQIRSKVRVATELLLGYLAVRSAVVNGRWTGKHTTKMLIKQLKLGREFWFSKEKSEP